MAEQRPSSNLERASHRNQLAQQFYPPALQQRVAFGMRDDGNQTLDAQLVQALGQLRRQRVVGKLDQQVRPPIHGVAAVARENRLKVLIAQMKIAAQRQ